jgi:hypothetical protein
MEVEWWGEKLQGMFWYASTFSFIYTCENSVAFSAPVLLEEMNAQQHYV